MPKDYLYLYLHVCVYVCMYVCMYICVGRIKNKICARAGIQLPKTDDEFKIVLPGTCQPSQGSNYYKPIYGHLHQKQLSEWMKLDFQEAIIRQEALS